MVTQLIYNYACRCFGFIFLHFFEIIRLLFFSCNIGTLVHESILSQLLCSSNIQILKHEWSGRWQSFIPDLVVAAKASETICENCMAILKVSLVLSLPPSPKWKYKEADLFSIERNGIIADVSGFGNSYCFMQLLSEEVFDFLRGEMTQQKIK